MKLIVGLGNPDTEYEKTRHNIGFMAVDAVASAYRCAAWKKKFKGFLTSAAEHDFLLLKPQTYMNLSGESVGEAVRFHKFPVSDVIVFHDDLDLRAGEVRVKQGGGHGGHNGLKSLDAHIGKDYWRVRLGIGHPLQGQGGDHPAKNEIVSNYVLGNFAKVDKAWLEPLLDRLAKELDVMLAGQGNDYAKRVTVTSA